MVRVSESEMALIFSVLVYPVVGQCISVSDL